MELIPIFIYGAFLSFILIYSFVEFHLVIRYLLHRNKNKPPSKLSEFPFVTIQLPIYNEANVIEELINSIAKIDYPKDKFEIQIIDDSTDETTEIISQKINELIKNNINCFHLRRGDREGYKAGALAYGLQFAKGEFIAIFDADFHPQKSFLLETIPQFANEKIGLIQTRWGHYNKNYSLITRLQALALDAHFTIEQTGRNTSNSFMNFNGTAGVWRKKCILESGGWHNDTITEDLDLSYRAQLKGWKFIYLENIVSPAELPVEMNGLKNQQLRWSKGAAECAKKHLKNVLKSSTISLQTKIHATFHLMNSFLYVCILVIAILSLPVIYIVKNYPEHSSLYSLFVIYYAGLVLIALTYLVSEIVVHKNKALAVLFYVLLFPLFLSISMGLSLFNSIGVIEGYLGIKTPFIRTPKYNVKSRKNSWTDKKYAVHRIKPLAILEGLLFLYFVYCLFTVIKMQNYWTFPYYIMLVLGFGFVFFSSIIHSVKVKA